MNKILQLLHISHFCAFLNYSTFRVGVITGMKNKSLDHQQIIELLRQHTKPRCLVNISTFVYRFGFAEERYHVACSEIHKFEKLCKRMKEQCYEPINMVQVRLFSSTRMIVYVDGRCNIVGGPVKLT